MKSLNVCGLCNGIVDIFADVSHHQFEGLGFDKGSMRLVGIEEQSGLLHSVGTESPVLRSGGSVANSMIAVAQLGGKSAVCCNLADDDYGRFYRDECIDLGIRVPVPLSRLGSTGTCVVLITPDAERTMRTSLGVSTELAPHHVDVKTIEDSEWLFIEGYVFSNSDEGRAAVSEAIIQAKRHQTKIAITCSDAWVVTGFSAPLREALVSTALVFANEEESRVLADAGNVVDSGNRLKDRFPHVVLTAGAQGAYIWWEGEHFHVPSFDCEPRDLTGAGDMFAGAFLYGITHGLSPYDAAHRACFLSSRVISQVGARLHGDVSALWSSCTL
jgi:sugar/nucleoside kinase (ribokinase family)